MGTRPACVSPSFHLPRASATFEIRRVFCFAFAIFLCAAAQYPRISLAQTTRDSEQALRAVANAVVNDSVFRFVDEKIGKYFKFFAEAPSDAQLRLASPHVDWRYWNGVLNIALLRIGEALHETSCSEFPVKNIAFSFDNFSSFEKRYKGDGKWNYPFGQRFVMEEPDDCGAMGASLIEVYLLDPQDRYRSCIDQAAAHILTWQTRQENCTFSRLFQQ